MGLQEGTGRSGATSCPLLIDDSEHGASSLPLARCWSYSRDERQLLTTPSPSRECPNLLASRRDEKEGEAIWDNRERWRECWRQSRRQCWERTRRTQTQLQGASVLSFIHLLTIYSIRKHSFCASPVPSHWAQEITWCTCLSPLFSPAEGKAFHFQQSHILRRKFTKRIKRTKCSWTQMHIRVARGLGANIL